MRKKKSKKKKNKQIRNIIIVLIMLAITCFIMTIAPNYKRENKSKTSIIIDNTEVTRKLEKDIIIENEDIIYIGMQDIKNLLDENLYFDENEKQIITSSDMHVAYINQEDSTMELNGVEIDLEHSLKQKEEIIYLPISDLETVYNIEINYLKEENVVIIESLSKEKNKATVNKTVSVKLKPTLFSRTIDKIKKGNSVTIIEDVEDNWMKVITDNGKIGYVKQKKLSNIYNVRQNMDREKASLSDYNLEEISIDTLENLGTLRNRKNWIEITIENVLLDNKDGVCFNLDAMTEYKEEYYRILVEIAPRLREIGKKTAVINNKIINTQDLLDIVDIVE